MLSFLVLKVDYYLSRMWRLLTEVSMSVESFLFPSHVTKHILHIYNIILSRLDEFVNPILCLNATK